MATVEEKYRFSQTGAGPLTDEQQHLVELLKKDVASIVAVRGPESLRGRPAHACQDLFADLWPHSLCLQNNAALQAFCNEHTYVRFLRAR